MTPCFVNHLRTSWNIDALFESHCRNSFRSPFRPRSVLLSNPGKVTSLLCFFIGNVVVMTLNSLSTLQVCLEDDYLLGGSEEPCRNHYIKMEG